MTAITILQMSIQSEGGSRLHFVAVLSWSWAAPTSRPCDRGYPMPYKQRRLVDAIRMP